MRSRLLVVEDESIVARDIMGRLSRLGYDVVGTAATGEDAIALARAAHPQVILMDIMLKGEMDGIEAARVIQETESTAVIYLTAYSDEATLSRARATSPYAYVLKPFSEHELHTAVEMALYRHAMENELRYRLALEGLVADISADLVSLRADELAAGLDRSLERLGRFAAVDRAYLVQLDEAGEAPGSAHEWCAPGLAKTTGDSKAVPCAIDPWVMGRLRQSESVVLRSVHDLPPEPGPLRGDFEAGNVAALLAVPVFVRGVFQGLMGFAMVSAPRDWHCDLPALLKVVADATGGALLRARSDEALARAKGDLEHRVRLRTAELEAAYASLKEEVAGREAADAARRKAEAQLAHSQRLESVGTLAGGVAHDFNNLLAIIMGHAELMLGRGHLMEADVAHAGTILSQGQRGAALVRQILDFGRRSPSDQHPLDLVQLTSETVALLARLIPESVEISFGCAGTDLHVTADPTQLQQVLTNLAVNSRDAMPEGGALRLAAHPFDLAPGAAAPVTGMAPGPWIELTVADTGTGMPPEVLDRILEPYFTTKEVGAGSGLGLSQVYGIVQ